MGCAFISSTEVVVKAVNKTSELVDIGLNRHILTLAPFEKANVGIVLKNGSKINALQISLEYNGDVMRVQNITSPFKMVDVDVHDNRLNITMLIAKKLSDNTTTIANLTIKALSKGFTVTSISRALAYDINGNIMNVSVSSKAVEVVVGNAVPEWTGIADIIFLFMELAALYLVSILAVVLIVIGIIIFLILKAKNKSYKALKYYFIVAALIILVFIYFVYEFFWWLK